MTVPGGPVNRHGSPASPRLISLSAGTVLEATPEESVVAAAAAGFGALGLRWRHPRPERSLPALRRRIEDAGLVLLDVEVVRLRPEVPVHLHRPLADVAGALGARFLLAVSEHPDPARTADELATVADWCAPYGVAVALEFMRFTAVPTFRSGVEILRGLTPDLRIVVDALHLCRGGERPTDLVGPDAGRIGYLQLCDAPLAPPAPADPAGLAQEARHDRFFPGEGELPLAELLAALPDELPCAVEVQSDSWSGTDIAARARHAMDSVRRLLPETA